MTEIGPAEDVKLSAALEATNGSFVCMYLFPFVKIKKNCFFGFS